MNGGYSQSGVAGFQGSPFVESLLDRDTRTTQGFDDPYPQALLCGCGQFRTDI